MPPRLGPLARIRHRRVLESAHPTTQGGRHLSSVLAQVPDECALERTGDWFAAAKPAWSVDQGQDGDGEGFQFLGAN
jgi:hypothetical protein